MTSSNGDIFRGLPFPLGPGSGKFVTDMIQDVAYCTCPYHLSQSSHLNTLPLPKSTVISQLFHDDVIKWRHFPRYWSFVRGMFSLICVWINDWVNDREAGDLRRYRAHYDVIVMFAIYGTQMNGNPVTLLNWRQRKIQFWLKPTNISDSIYTIRDFYIIYTSQILYMSVNWCHLVT